MSFAVFADDLFRIPHRARFVKNFFREVLFFSVLRVSAAALADSFVRIPPHSPFVNTFSALKIDIKKRKPVFDNVYAGLSGPAIKPIALKMVREVAKAVKVPVIGMGGITTAEDAIEFIMAGAHLIQFGTASFINPYAGKDIVEGIEAFMKEENIKSLDEIRGII